MCLKGCNLGTGGFVATTFSGNFIDVTLFQAVPIIFLS